MCITDALLWTPLIMSDGPSSEDAAGWESAWLASIASEKISIPDVCCPVILTPCCQACVRALDVVRAWSVHVTLHGYRARIRGGGHGCAAAVHVA